MSFAQVVIDIPTHSLTGTFDYRIPEHFDGAEIDGSMVAVRFGHRLACGYVISISEKPSSDIDQTRISEILRVFPQITLSKRERDLAQWIADAYASPLLDAVKLFLPPGKKPKVKRNKETGLLELDAQVQTLKHDRWIHLLDRDFTPLPQASLQRQIIAALSEGSLAQSELKALIGSNVTSVLKRLHAKGVIAFEEQEVETAIAESRLSSARAVRPQRLTDEQAEVLSVFEDAASSGRSHTILVDGVTGSGKTEVYLQIIEKILAQGKGAVVLIPEISLTAQTLGRFRSRFGKTVAVLHSSLSDAERFDQWMRVKRRQARVVIGPRSALFAPLDNLGVLIIDEEHEHTYKQEQGVRYHARFVAQKLTELHSAQLLLGSATPSFESLLAAERGSDYEGRPWLHCRLTQRAGMAQLPKITVVDMTEEFQSGQKTLISRPLKEALLETIERREKAVLLLNRRGFATFLMCRSCGCVPECPHCSSALTYHERTHLLVCHSCGESWHTLAYPNPLARCPQCESPYMAAYGAGTQRLELELEALVGDRAEIIRMDADTTATKGAHEQLLEQFDAAESAVLVGTQMIAKGLDFPEVTLVGVLNADALLKLPDFRAAERTWALMEQVAGRAGRSEKPGRVYIQSYWAHHPAFQAVKTHDRRAFIRSELSVRKEFSYPPYTRVCNVVISALQEDLAERIAQRLAVAFQNISAESTYILGPAPCVKSKLKDRYRFHILVKCPPDSKDLTRLASCIAEAEIPRSVRVTCDIDAYQLM